MRMAFVNFIVPARILSRQLEREFHRVLPVFQRLAHPDGSGVPLVREFIRGDTEIV